MREISDWMLSESVALAMVGAHDPQDDDKIKWISGVKVNATVWMAGEPMHSSGDCVYFNAVQRLFKMGSCDESSNNHICRWYPA